MAMTATISISPTTVKTNQRVIASVTVSNSGASDVNVLSVTPLIKTTGTTDPTYYNTGAALGVVDLGPGAITTVPAGGDLVLAFDLDAFAPSLPTYDVLARLRCSDGSTFETSPAAVLTVEQIPQISQP